MEKKIKVEFQDHTSVLLTDEVGNTYSSKSMELMDFLHGADKINIKNHVSEKHSVVVLTDLIDVIHYTIIKNRGENIVALDEIQRLEYLLKGSKELENYSVEETGLWKSIMRQRNGFKTN